MPQNYKETDKKDENSKYVTTYKQDYESDWDVHRSVIQSYDALEAMMLGSVYDSVSNSVDGSKITDNYAATLAKERADRVIAKLPDGETQSAGRADVGKSVFMDILRQKWVYPNANAQHPFLEKLALWQLGSDQYGWFPMFYDWTTSSTGYVGPDCWLWNPRNFIPQQGRVSIQDMDYATALTWLSKKRLQDILDNPEEGDGWDRDALQELVSRTEKTAGNDTQKDTFIERDRAPGGTKRGICLATRYEAGPDGNWCTFAPDDGYIEVRKLKNPHKNGRIPFVIKYSQPLFDSFYGLGSFQLDKPLQFARDGLTNFYFANLKRNLAPGIIVNANGVVKHTLDVTKANPVLMETIPNSIRPMPTNTAGLSTYQAAQSALTGAMLARNGSQNASIPGADALNPSQGKTPAAINLYSDKEASTDGAARRRMEAAIEQLTDGFFSLIANIGTEDIPVSLFQDDIEDIRKAGMEDIVGLFSGNFKPDQTLTAGDLTIKPGALKGVEYRFSIAPNSTAQVSKDAQRTAIENWMGTVSKFANSIQSDPRITINWNEIMESYSKLSDIKGTDRFITFDPSKPSPEEQQAQMEQQKAQMAQQSQTQLPGGQVRESADLDKMWQAAMQAGDKPLADQIIQALGFQPSPEQPQPIANAAGVFSNPHVAAAAEHIQGLTTTASEPPQMTTNSTGIYSNPHIGDVADQVNKAFKSKQPVGGPPNATR
jgi:hypothetical protein